MKNPNIVHFHLNKSILVKNKVFAFIIIVCCLNQDIAVTGQPQQMQKVGGAKTGGEEKRRKGLQHRKNTDHIYKAGNIILRANVLEIRYPLC